MNISYSYNEIHADGNIKLDDKAITNNFLKNLKQGNKKTQIILTSNASKKDLIIPDGVTLIIPEGVTFTQLKNYQLKGDIIINGKLEGSKYYNETMKSYHTNYSKVTGYSSNEKNDKIKLIDDVTETENIVVSGDRILLLDLNGHSISVTKNIQCTSGGKLTIIDTSKDKTGKINANVKVVGSNGNITIKGGTITGLVTINNYEGAAMTIDDGIINGSVINNASLTIKNGTFSEIPVTEENGVTTLFGGTYPLGEFTEATIPEEVTVIKGSKTQTIKSKSDLADYTKLDQLIKQVNDMDLTAYTDETVKHLTDIIDGINHTLTILDQEKVDEYVIDVEKAIKDLVIKPGKIIINIKEDFEEHFVKINNGSEELKNLFTQEELSKINDGENGAIYIQVKNIESQLSETEKNLINVIGKATGYKYFDFSLFKKIGTQEALKITECSLPIFITIKVPTNLINTSNSIDRIYHVVRLHDGKAEIIDGTFDKGKREFTFKTDKFSLYALAYTDIQKEENKLDEDRYIQKKKIISNKEGSNKEENKLDEDKDIQKEEIISNTEESNKEENKLNEDTENSTTYDKSVLYIFIAIIFFLVLLAGALYIKQKILKNNN